MKTTKKQIAEAIENAEYYMYKHVNCVQIIATNVRVYKKQDLVVANVLLQTEDEKTKYNDCEYKLSDLIK